VLAEAANLPAVPGSKAPVLSGAIFGTRMNKKGDLFQKITFLFVIS
jgi:hypothetical protein